MNNPGYNDFPIMPTVKAAGKLRLECTTHKVRQDNMKFLDSTIVCSEDGSNSSRGQLAAVNTVLKFGGRKTSAFKTSRRVPARANDQGQLVASRGDAALAILKYFGTVEAADICS